MGRSDERRVEIGKLPPGLHHHRLIKSFLALEMITDSGHVDAGALADFAKMRSMETRFGE